MANISEYKELDGEDLISLFEPIKKYDVRR